MLIEKIDPVGLESLKRRVDGRSYVVWLAVEAEAGAIVVVGEPELGGDHDPVADWDEGHAEEGLVGEGPVGLSGVKERDATIDSLADQGDAFTAVNGFAVVHAQTHAAETNGADLDLVRAEFTGGDVRDVSSPVRWWSAVARLGFGDAVESE